MTCKKHLQDNKMSYFQHLIHSWSMAFALAIHGVFPGVLETYASDKIKKHQESIDKTN